MEAVEDFKQDEIANIPNSLLISASYIGKTKKVISQILQSRVTKNLSLGR